VKTAQCKICGKPQPAPANPFGALSETPGRLARLLRGLTAAERLWRPAPGKWSIHELVCHLADTEVANAWRYRKLLAEDTSGPTGWDQNRWAAAHRYRRQDLKLALQQFTVLRERNLGLLRVVGRKAWTKTVAHPALGTISTSEVMIHLAHHDTNHLGQIERIREAVSARRRAAGR
jgi:uncharacterized damage-inducible protein DinB